MQYILTQQEYDALTPVKRLQDANEALETCRKELLSANNFTCIHESKSNNRRYFGYCDDCPVSFKRVGHENSRLICAHSKNYSK